MTKQLWFIDEVKKRISECTQIKRLNCRKKKRGIGSP